MAFVTKKEISSRWQIIFKEAETKLLLNLECKEAFSPPFPINFKEILVLYIAPTSCKQLSF